MFQNVPKYHNFFLKNVSKWPKITQKCSKLSHNVPNFPGTSWICPSISQIPKRSREMAPIVPECPKISQIVAKCLKLSRMSQICIEMSRNVPKWPKTFHKCRKIVLKCPTIVTKCSKVSQYCLEMHQNVSKWSKIAQKYPNCHGMPQTCPEMSQNWAKMSQNCPLKCPGMSKINQKCSKLSWNIPKFPETSQNCLEISQIV